MRASVAEATMLRDLVDVLIPGEAGWPSASHAGVHGVVAMRLMELRGEGAVSELSALVDRCGGPLVALDEAARVAVVERLEAAEPDLFALLRNATFLAYYEHPAVVRQVQALGQPYRPVPHVEGYALPPFDPERDRPRHNRGHWLRTEDVRRLQPVEGTSR